MATHSDLVMKQRVVIEFLVLKDTLTQTFTKECSVFMEIFAYLKAQLGDGIQAQRLSYSKEVQSCCLSKKGTAYHILGLGWHSAHGIS